jgi:hypothetical protein
VKHFATRRFWEAYERLPPEVREIADRNYALMRDNPKHSSLHLKRVGDLWSVRVGLGYRALGRSLADDIVWMWIGTHSEYNSLIGGTRG